MNGHHQGRIEAVNRHAGLQFSRYLVLPLCLERTYLWQRTKLAVCWHHAIPGLGAGVGPDLNFWKTTTLPAWLFLQHCCR